jgi:hypothetical protein
MWTTAKKKFAKQQLLFNAVFTSAVSEEKLQREYRAEAQALRLA